MDPAYTSYSSSTLETPAANGAGLGRAALWLSIFSFILPLGIAAIVLGHIAESRPAKASDKTNGKSHARAALWIAYIQLAIFSLAGVVLWGLFRDTAQGFRRDAIVQRAFRSHAESRTLDPESARQTEAATELIVAQLMAIEDRYHRDSEGGVYMCQVEGLLQLGVEGMTDAEKQAFAARVLEAPYLFEISRCNPVIDGATRPAYVLTAVPRLPRMPEGSKIFCSDESEVIRESRGRTSVDCLNNGESVR